MFSAGFMLVKVDCYAGYRGEQTPRRIDFRTRTIEVVEIIDSWLAPDHRYFKVLADDGAGYILRHDPIEQSWTISLSEKATPQK